MAEFTKLFEPGKMGNVILKNRIIMAPCGTHYSSHYGVVTDQQLAYYGERAKGGASLIVTEGASTRKPPRGKPGRILVNEDKFIPGLKKLANIIHAGGAKAGVAQHAAGRAADQVTGDERCGQGRDPEGLEE